VSLVLVDNISSFDYFSAISSDWKVEGWVLDHKNSISNFFSH
jgi:hypothetical protein